MEVRRGSRPEATKAKRSTTILRNCRSVPRPRARAIERTTFLPRTRRENLIIRARSRRRSRVTRAGARLTKTSMTGLPRATSHQRQSSSFRPENQARQLEQAAGMTRTMTEMTATAGRNTRTREPNRQSTKRARPKPAFRRKGTMIATMVRS